MLMLVAGTGWAAEHTIQSSPAQEHPLHQAPRFTVASSLVMASGSFSLKWTYPDSPTWGQFELQQGTGKDFSTAEMIYSGPDQGTYVSGLPNGEFFYRVRAVDPQETKMGQWSSTIQRTVKHPSLEFALGLMGVGATVFLSTIGMIAMGICREPS